jgi:hypothetical protein
MEVIYGALPAQLLEGVLVDLLEPHHSGPDLVRRTAGQAILGADGVVELEAELKLASRS